MKIDLYKTKNRIRIVTATSLYDGHDVAINVIRRILQSSGSEVIHLGHSRSIDEIVECAIQEDVQGVAITCYQGGHLECYKYTHDLLKKRNASHIKIFGGGGGTILPIEIQELHDYGIDKIYSPDDGRSMGLQGMINDLLSKSDFSTTSINRFPDLRELSYLDTNKIGYLISLSENHPKLFQSRYKPLLHKARKKNIPVIGVTGTGGSGKSTLVDELIKRYLIDFPDKTLAVVAMDPSKRKMGGALLGDRIRMNSINNPRVFMRSMATRDTNTSLSKNIDNVIDIFKASAFDCIIVETSGIGQSGSEIVDYCNLSIYVMTQEYGAPLQLEKIDMLDYCDLVAMNKMDKLGSLDALKDVKKQYKINNNLWSAEEKAIPVFGTMASQYNDYGTSLLYKVLMDKISLLRGFNFPKSSLIGSKQGQELIIQPARIRYLGEIAEMLETIDININKQTEIAQNLFQIKCTIDLIQKRNKPANTSFQKQYETLKQKSNVAKSTDETKEHLKKVNISNSNSEYDKTHIQLKELYHKLDKDLNDECRKIIKNWADLRVSYENTSLKYKVRDKVLEHDLYFTSLSGTKIPKVCIPKLNQWGDIIKWVLKENVPGKFPFTSGVFPLKRKGETTARMTAGEGGAEASNKRFHYLSRGQIGKRISTAHDSVTLYGDDPCKRPDIYGKVGSTGVSISTIDDSKKLYSGFNLCSSNTSVNLTINGPAPMLLGFFLNTAIDQQCELYIKKNGLTNDVKAKIKSLFNAKDLPIPSYNGKLPKGNDGLGLLLLGVSGDQVLEQDVYEKIKAKTLRSIRGTVQADILKEVQAQNTCIFPADFALKMMGDIQEYFIENQINNFYSISVSGYHIAEAGANPITQLSFTLANAFTYVEYYISRGMHIDSFANNISFFFSNGMDAEYAVLGRVARRIWARTIKHKYSGNERSQKLKYHIQTSGRSLHAQEIGFNDIRTTLQAFYALSDNCNSLHTNASDEAVSLPTEDSVRKALAIQLVIDNEFGVAKNENFLQGSYIIEELTDKVEKAVIKEFVSISKRGGVIGAMEKMYQSSKIQEESHEYETQKHNGELPIVGVNTFLNSNGSPTILPNKVTRLTDEDRNFIIESKEFFKRRNQDLAPKALTKLKKVVNENGNIFEEMMDACKVCTLGQISDSLYQVGGRYRRNT